MKRNLLISVACLIVTLVLVFSVTSISFTKINFENLNEKYQYVYKIMATKPIDSEACLIAELVSDSDDYYCSFRVTEVIFGECEADKIRVRLPGKDAITGHNEAYQESGSGFRYGYFHFLTNINSRDKILCDFKVGEKYLLCLAGSNKSGNDITYNSVLFLGKDNYPLSESDIENPEDFILMSDYLKYVSEKVEFNCPDKYKYDELEKQIRKYIGFSIYEMFER